MSRMAKLFSMLYPTNIHKNFLQILIGGVLFYLIFGQISLKNLILGGISFVLFYQFTYALNDAVDYKHDIKDKNIIKKKLVLRYPLHSGVVKTKQLLSFSALVSIIGIFLSTLINSTFFIVQLSLLAFTFIHSNPFFSIKKISLLLYANMILIQFIKFSLGWLTQTTNFESFPYWLFILSSSFYVAIYRLYKSHFLTQLSFRDVSGFFIISVLIVSFVASLFLYKIPLALIILAIFSSFLSYYYILRPIGLEGKTKIVFIALPFFVAFCLIISIILVKADPILFSINNSIADLLDDLVNFFS